MRKPDSFDDAPAPVQEVLEAFLAARGSFEAARTRLGLSVEAFELRLRQVRRLGMGRRATLVAAPASGHEIELRSYVKLAASTAAEFTAFEAVCTADRVVASASLISGRHDYVLISFHPGLTDAQTWAKGLRARPEIVRADIQTVRTILGHAWPDLLLFPLDAACARQPAARRRRRRAGADGLDRSRLPTPSQGDEP